MIAWRKIPCARDLNLRRRVVKTQDILLKEICQ